MGPHSAVTGAPSLLCCRLRMHRCTLLSACGPWKGDSPLPSPSSLLSDPGSQRARLLHQFWGPAQTLDPGVLRNSSPKGSASHRACGTWTEFSGVKALPSYDRQGSRAAQLIHWQVAPRETPGLVLMPFHLNRPGTADLPAWSLPRACAGGQRGAEGRREGEFGQMEVLPAVGRAHVGSVERPWPRSHVRSCREWGGWRPSRDPGRPG